MCAQPGSSTSTSTAPLLVAALLCGVAGPEPAALDAWAGVLRATPSALLWLVGVPEAALDQVRFCRDRFSPYR